jgi:hypothetical protein
MLLEENYKIELTKLKHMTHAIEQYPELFVLISEQQYKITEI